MGKRKGVREDAFSFCAVNECFSFDFFMWHSEMAPGMALRVTLIRHIIVHDSKEHWELFDAFSVDSTKCSQKRRNL